MKNLLKNTENFLIQEELDALDLRLNFRSALKSGKTGKSWTSINDEMRKGVICHFLIYIANLFRSFLVSLNQTFSILCCYNAYTFLVDRRKNLSENLTGYKIILLQKMNLIKILKIELCCYLALQVLSILIVSFSYLDA